MPTSTYSEDTYGGPSSSRFLAASNSSLRKSPSRQSLSRHRSTASLRASPLAQDDDAANGRYSLAHELAVALQPEPSVGSKLLAEEFGIEYDEGAEGIDDPVIGEPVHSISVDSEPVFAAPEDFDAADQDASTRPTTPSLEDDPDPALDPTFDSPPPAARRRQRPEQDAMAVLAQDLESTEKLLSHLRRLDADTAGPGGSQPALEKIASDVIRHINDTARDREGQVRELLEYEREFRKIAGEVGGGDALASLDELEGLDELADQPASATANGDASRAETRRLDAVAEESSFAASNDWEVDPDRHMHDDDDALEHDASPVKDAFSLPPPPPIAGALTPIKTVPQLAHLRTSTSSLVSSLSVISEHAQVNGAATTEAGRKIRALKNKLGGWRTDWDSAERSRVRIERWEAGLGDGDGSEGADALATGVRRMDGRKIVEEHLRAFELALSEANVKTQAIMAAS
ncbi:hypothetical protein FA95DRAFT_1558619 [Auriscalpium vulgare]|uniref:Uncharacterized protein n=1 Tax=Auriscalpium vulgare TaxID=40419 RepID=A0ACB8RW66_9AGAM|nr:hypothetical protein FA95DRAFT_1558619 [Auriscalpium vulgare]